LDKDRATDFADKAEKLLKWCDQYLEDMRQYGRSGDVELVERTFVSLLLLFDSIHQALADSAKKLDLYQWRDQLIQVREQDSLLRYLWKARNSEAHDALVKWHPSMKHVDFRIVDPQKAAKIANPAVVGQRAAISKLICYAYEVENEQALIEKMKSNPKPSVQAQQEAGIQLLQSLDSLSLDDFTIGRDRNAETVAAPPSHLDATLPPSADQAVFYAIKFYRGKLDELKVHIGETGRQTT
jgi:hypothetical protein